jgi:hypothetical protein
LPAQLADPAGEVDQIDLLSATARGRPARPAQEADDP